MAKFCLTKDVADSFVNKLKDGTINPEKMMTMASEERNKFLSGIVGEENGKNANALFESKMLLKNQKKGMITWAETIMGTRPEVKRDIVATIQRMDKVLNPDEAKMFMADLAEQKLGVSVSQTEAKQISTLSSKAEALREGITEALPDGAPKRLEYGAAKVDLMEYVSGLKTEAKRVKLSEYFSKKGVLRGVSDLAGLAKAMKASLDDSAVFRQGWKTMFTNPTDWGRNAVQSFRDIARSLKGDDVMKAIKTEVYSRDNAMNGMYDMMKLEVGLNEEAFPTSLPERVPGLGKLFTASETAYKGFLLRMRADIADKTLIIAKNAGVNTADKFEAESIGNLINSITGRGNLGSFEKVGKEVNNVLFSPKLLKSHIDTLTAHSIRLPGEKEMSSFARKRAAINLTKIVVGTSFILGVAKALNPNSVDLDPRSSDFGKIKVGNTRFDVSGGMSSVVTLASRILPTKDEKGRWGQFTKSSISGRLSKLNSGEFGSMTALDVMVNFASNKLSPMARVVLELAQQRDFNNKQITLGGEISNLLLPLPVNTYQTLKDEPNSANILLSLIADGMGISTNTYGSSETRLETFLGNKNPNPKITAEIDRLAKTGNAPAIGNIESSEYSKRLKDQISPAKYKQFVQEFGAAYEVRMLERIESPLYKSKTVENKKKALEDDKSKVLESLLKKYGYKKPKKTSSTQY